MKEKLEHILSNAMSQIEQSGELDKLNEIRVAFLGKKGELTGVLKSISASLFTPASSAALASEPNLISFAMITVLLK